MNLRQKS